MSTLMDSDEATGMERLGVGFSEVKFHDDGGAPGTFSGYGAVFGNVDSYGDVIAPGAFGDSLSMLKSQDRRVPMYVQHAFGDVLPVGVWTKVEEDAHGLKVEGRISGLETDHGKRIHALVRDGALSGLSIGYRVAKNGATYGSKPSEPRRTLRKIDLVEISLVDQPANALARVESVKSISELATLSEIERHLRDARGFSRSEAKALVSHIKSVALRDAGAGEIADKLNKLTALLTSR